MKSALPILCFLSLTTVASACNIPVFRYALERWRPDSSNVVVFHNSPLSDAQRNSVKNLQSLDANVKVLQQSTDAPMDDSIALLWDELSKQPDLQLPYVVVRSSVAGTQVYGWRGSLAETEAVKLLSSPVRQELSKRLLSGHSAVWLVLKSNDAARNAEVVSLLQGELQQLSEEIPLPEGIGLPGSELFSEIPLLMRFSVLEIDPADSDEQFLTSLLKGFEPDSIDNGQPLVVPVFGRGRALEVIPAGQVNAGLVEDLTLFLCGACSCQVKERNPGFDLLISAKWEAELFGENAEMMATKFSTEEEEIGLPVLLEIPSGKADSEVEATLLVEDSPIVNEAVGQAAISQESESTSGVAWVIGLLAVFVTGLAVSHSMKS
jgi:hypothetical protein